MTCKKRALINLFGGLWDATEVYRDRRVASLFFFGFSSGLPLALTGATLLAWLTEAGVSLQTIGLAALVGFSYNFKFLWAPLIDQMTLPLLTRGLGLRRGWILVSQLMLIISIFGIARSDPATSDGLWWIMFWAAVAAFASATQDIAVDAYRTEILKESQLGAGAAMLTLGYRIAMLVAGGGALIIAGYIDWSWAYITMSGFVLVGVACVLVNPEPTAALKPPIVRKSSGIFPALSWLAVTFGDPFREFGRRPQWVLILLFVLFFKTGDALIGHMSTTFYLMTGFSLVEIGLVSKGYGLFMTLFGAVIGGYLVAKIGLLNALIATGILQAVSNLVFIIQAEVGYSIAMLTVTIGIENLTGGMGTTAFVAYLSSLCNLSFTATQYALLSSLFAQSRTIFAASSGWLVERFDWVIFFGFTVLAAMPGLFLLFYLRARQETEVSVPST